MKKLFDKTVGGYYVMSIVLGILMMLAIGEIIEVAVLYAPLWGSVDTEGATYVAEMMARNQFWNAVWEILPLRLAGRFLSGSCQNLVMVGTMFAAVALFVMMSNGKSWRTKVLQTLGVTLLALFVLTAVAMATTSVLTSPLWALLPVVASVIPLVILKKTREPVKDSLIAKLRSVFWRSEVGSFVTENLGLSRWCAAVALFYIGLVVSRAMGF